ncbi:amino acid deaminase [Pseudomonas indica]|uniref:amino acid deaminase n=1 Tax=Pseudomonas indica TaxID=137658 RepID=UPI0023F7D2C7|nr:amino acid deaminase [Pseudomonas indica]MBU3059028.1 amino acid deaminase [Pseudomonas indica]
MSLPILDKGLPQGGRRLLSDVSLPALVIHNDALEHNLRWMQRYAEQHGLLLAPHGKTTMTPALFQRQLDQGAWGITLATAVQCRAAYAHGVRRLLLANQLVGAPNMALVAELLGDPEVDFHCLVDHPDNVAELGRFFGERGLRLNVMIEVGVPDGRCGCRSAGEAQRLAEVVAAQPALALTGIEGYEGVIHGEDSADDVRDYAERLVAIAVDLLERGLFALERPIVTASGSAWYDLIAEAFDRRDVRERFTGVLRPGCYVVHDHGLYGEAQTAVQARHPDWDAPLRPAMEVWAHVQSLPEPGRAIVALGKRDIASDAMPQPLRRYRPGSTVAEDVSAWRVSKLMDQHAFMDIPGGAALQVGDIIAFGASHPCLTFDKWRQICLVDAELQVIETLPTFF